MPTPYAIVQALQTPLGRTVNFQNENLDFSLNRVLANDSRIDDSREDLNYACTGPEASLD